MYFVLQSTLLEPKQAEELLRIDLYWSAQELSNHVGREVKRETRALHTRGCFSHTGILDMKSRSQSSIPRTFINLSQSSYRVRMIWITVLVILTEENCPGSAIYSSCHFYMFWIVGIASADLASEEKRHFTSQKSTSYNPVVFIPFTSTCDEFSCKMTLGVFAHLQAEAATGVWV